MKYRTGSTKIRAVADLPVCNFGPPVFFNGLTAQEHALRAQHHRNVAHAIQTGPGEKYNHDLAQDHSALHGYHSAAVRHLNGFGAAPAYPNLKTPEARAQSAGLHGSVVPKHTLNSLVTEYAQTGSHQ